MAARLTSRERAELYRQIFLLNRSFDLIVQRLGDLAQTRIFNARDIREMCGLTQEVQLEINTALLGPLDSLEHDDWGEFGKATKRLRRRFHSCGRTKKGTGQTGPKVPAQNVCLVRAVLRPEKE